MTAGSHAKTLAHHPAPLGSGLRRNDGQMAVMGIGKTF